MKRLWLFQNEKVAKFCEIKLPIEIYIVNQLLVRWKPPHTGTHGRATATVEVALFEAGDRVSKNIILTTKDTRSRHPVATFVLHQW